MKYGNRRVQWGGVTYDSQKEASRGIELRHLAQLGEIEGLVVHPTFTLQPAFTHAGKKYRAVTYTADFAYTEKGRRIVEDVKGGSATKTESYRIRKRLLLYQHGGSIDEFRES